MLYCIKYLYSSRIIVVKGVVVSYKNLSWTDGIKKYFLVLSMLTVFFILLIRNFGIYPVVFADEYGYSLYSRIFSLKDSPLPDYLYLAIFKKTNYCGDGFLGCARILNNFFYVAATPFIYSIAKQVCTKNVASFIALLALLSPVNSYTAYFMPESTYYFAFWMFAWFILTLNAESRTSLWCLAGGLLGILSLIKPHGLLLFPASMLYVFYVKKQTEKPWIWQALISTSFFIVFALIIKFFVGYLFAGKSGITLFGVTYTSIADSATSGTKHYIELLSLALINIKGHMLVIFAIFGTSIAIALSILGSSGTEIKPAQKIAFFALAILFTLIPLIGLFAASIVDHGPYESIGRLSMRYYNFVFPLLLIIAASQFSIRLTNIRKYKVVIAFIIGSVLVYGVLGRFTGYVPSYIDCPEFAVLLDNPALFNTLAILSLLALILWVYTPQLGAKLFMYIMMPIFVAYSMYYIHFQFRNNINPTVFDKAGIFTRLYVPVQERSKVLIVGTQLAGLYRSLFYLDNSQASCEGIPAGGKYDFSKIPKDKEWILVIGNDVPRNNKFTQVAMDGYMLMHVSHVVESKVVNRVQTKI